MKIFFIFWLYSADCLSSSNWEMLSSNSETPSTEFFAQLTSLSPSLERLCLELAPVCTSNFPRMVGSGDSIHSRNLERPSSSRNAFTTSMALTIPIPLHQNTPIEIQKTNKQSQLNYLPCKINILTTATVNGELVEYCFLVCDTK